MLPRSLLNAFTDELQKIAVSTGNSDFMQTRKGRRPIRVQTLLARNSQDESSDESASDIEHEAGPGMQGEDVKVGSVRAEKREDRKNRTIRGFVRARPYVKSAITGGIPLAVAAKMLLPEVSLNAGRLRRALSPGRVGFIVGATGGVADKYLRDWAEKNKRKQISKEILKVGGFAADGRRTGIGGVKRPPMPTADSVSFATKKLNQSKRVGAFSPPKQLVKGPAINMVGAGS